MLKALVEKEDKNDQIGIVERWKLQKTKLKYYKIKLEKEIKNTFEKHIRTLNPTKEGISKPEN